MASASALESFRDTVGAPTMQYFIMQEHNIYSILRARADNSIESPEAAKYVELERKRRGKMNA